MSKLDKVKYVLQDTDGSISIDEIASITNFDKDLVEFMVSELESIGKVSINSKKVTWTSKRR